MQLHAFVINLDRRPDRLSEMAVILNRLALDWTRVPARDAAVTSRDDLAGRVAPDGHRMPMGPGSQCCALTNFDIYQRILDADLPAALVLQDDVELAADLPALCDAVAGTGFGLVQMEHYGTRRSTPLVGPGLTLGTTGRSLHRLRSRSLGAAAYVVTADAAARLLAHPDPLRMPIDHFLFNPRISPVFPGLSVGIVMPAAARQRPASASDMAAERAARPKAKGVRARLARLGYDCAALPGQATALAGGARFRPLSYRP